MRIAAPDETCRETRGEFTRSGGDAESITSRALRVLLDYVLALRLYLPRTLTESTKIDIVDKSHIAGSINRGWLATFPLAPALQIRSREHRLARVAREQKSGGKRTGRVMHVPCTGGARGAARERDPVTDP